MKNSEAPGAANRSNPKRARRIPSTKTSHQGRVSPLLPADILTLHLPRRLPTLSSPHYWHETLTTASIPPTICIIFFLPLFTNVVEGEFSEVRALKRAGAP